MRHYDDAPEPASASDMLRCRKVDWMKTMMRDWTRRRIIQASDMLHGRRPRRYAFRVRAIRAAFSHEYKTWDLSRWMGD